MSANRITAGLILAAGFASAQWVHYPTAGIPRTKDGKPNLVSFQLENGVYIVPRIVDAGYLALGKRKLDFSRQITGK